jgi:predicted DNA-binding transcriptional regulator AlpA
VDSLLTIAEVAAITRAPIASVRAWRAAGTGPRSCRIGRRVVYRETDVADWISERFSRTA